MEKITKNQAWALHNDDQPVYAVAVYNRVHLFQDELYANEFAEKHNTWVLDWATGDYI